MSCYETRPHNPNGHGITRSGFTTGNQATDAHPTDGNWIDSALEWAVWSLIAACILAACWHMGWLPLWADTAMQVAK